jgi:hypothetical protein
MHQLPKDQTHHDRAGSSKHTTGEQHRSQELGPTAPLGPVEPLGLAAPLGPAARAQLAQTCHQASVTQRNTTANDPDRRNKVSLIQRLRLASLGSMDPQASEQPMCDNIQGFIYPLEHVQSGWQGGPGLTTRRGPATPPLLSKPTHNHLLTASGTKSQTHDRRWWKSQGWPHMEIGLHLLAKHCIYISPTSTPSCSHRPIGAINCVWHLMEEHKWLEASGAALQKLVFRE